MDQQIIKELRITAAERVRLADQNLLNEFPTKRYIAQLDAIDVHANYRSTTPEIQAICTRILQHVGEPGLAHYHQLVLLELIQDFEPRAREHRYPDSVRTLFQAQFQRITKAIEQQRPGPYLFRSDSFCKDLAICRQRLIPCGAQLVEKSGIPRSWTVRVGARHCLRLLRTVAKLGGFRTLYEPHTDHRQLLDFNPAGWTRYYVRLAELLRLNPEIRGVCCSAWWYDPEVGVVSPRLRYLREVPESGGAEFFCLGTSEQNTADATANSPERHRRYLEGKYQPKSYGLIWPRREFLNKVAAEGWKLAGD